MANDIISALLSKYDCQTHSDYENAIKEIIQEIILLGLWRSKFFEKAAFYGETALRILYGLDRFSEDLDFSLLKPSKNFQLSSYLNAIKSELNSFGIEVLIDEKTKETENSIQSDFIKAWAKQTFLKINVPSSIHQITHKKENMKIKIEIDTNPPGKFNVETKILFQPIAFSVNTYQLPDLFAGKLHAVLCRQWKKRIKGRDWYDLIWYIRQNIPVRLAHLQKRLEQTEHWKKTKKITIEDLKRLLKNKINEVDFESAKKEVLPFLKDPSNVALWSKDFFQEIILKIKSS